MTKEGSRGSQCLWWQEEEAESHNEEWGGRKGQNNLYDDRRSSPAWSKSTPTHYLAPTWVQSFEKCPMIQLEGRLTRTMISRWECVEKFANHMRCRWPWLLHFKVKERALKSLPITCTGKWLGRSHWGRRWGWFRTPQRDWVQTWKKKSFLILSKKSLTSNTSLWRM